MQGIWVWSGYDQLPAVLEHPRRECEQRDGRAKVLDDLASHDDIEGLASGQTLVRLDIYNDRVKSCSLHCRDAGGIDVCTNTLTRYVREMLVEPRWLDDGRLVVVDAPKVKNAATGACFDQNLDARPRLT